MPSPSVSAMDSKKRKREADPALVVFNVPDRPGFARLLVEDETLEQLKMVVRKKLGVEKHASVKLEWLRDGRAIALSDKDDMSAFHVFAKSTPSVDVNVSLHAEEMPPPPVPVSASARHRTKEPVPDPSNSFAKDLARTINSSLQRDDAGPKPKKRKTSLGPVQGKASVEAPQARPRLVPHDVESRESSVIPDEMISYALALVNPASSSSEPAFKPKKPKKLASNESKESILARSAESRRGGTAPSSAAKFVGDDGTNGVPVNNKKAAKKDKKAKLSPAGQDSDSRRNVSESLTSALAGPSRSAAGFLPSAESDKQDAEGKKKALSKDGHLDNISATLTETSKHKKRRRKRTSSVAPTPDRETAPAVIPAFASVPTAPPANDTPQANTLTRKDKTEQKRQKKERKLRQPTLPLDAPARVATTPTDDAAPPSSTGNKRNIERATLREGAPASSESRKRRKVDANIERDDGSCEGAAVHRGKKKQIGDATIVPSTPQIDLVEAINAANRSPYLPAALPAGSAHIGVENKPKDKEGHTVRSQDSDFADDARKATDAAPPFKAQTQTSSQTVKANPIQPQKPPTLQEKVEKVKEQRHSTQEDRRISTGSSTSDEHDLPSISAAASTASSRAPTIPSRLKIQEVAVETQDEGSSNESSDDDEPTVGVIERSRAPILDDDEDPALRAIIRGPGLHVDHSVLDDLPSDDEEGNEDDEDGLLEDAGVHSDEEDEDPKLARTATRYPGTRMTSVAPSEESSADSEQITGHVKHFVPTVVVDSARNHAPGEPVDAEMADAILEKPASEPVVNSIADANSSSPLAGVSAAEPAVPSFGAIGASSDDTFHPAPSSRAQTVEDSESGRPDKHSRFIEKNLEDTLNGTITARKPAVRGKPGPTSPTSSPAPAAPQASEIVPQTSPSQSREGTPPAWAGILVPGSDSPRSSHQNVEDLLDPIEPSEDLFDANVDDKVDPIESAPTQPQVQLSSPPRTPKHGTSKRMKDRHGNASQKSDTPGLTTLSELQSKLSDAMAATTSPKNGMRPLSSLPPPVLLPAVKRARGRPPLSEEVKAARAAEREKVKAEKAAKAAAAKEQKMAKAAAAKAEKAAKAKEKAAREAKKTRSKSRGASVTPESEDVEHRSAAHEAPSPSAEQPEDDDEPTGLVPASEAASPQTPSQTRSRLTQPSSAVPWATLAGEVTDAEMLPEDPSMIDQLETSSVAPAEEVRTQGSLPGTSRTNKDRHPEQALVVPPSSPPREDVFTRDSDGEGEVQNTDAALATSDPPNPLFLESETQHQYPTNTQAVALTKALGKPPLPVSQIESESSSSDNDSDEQPLARVQSGAELPKASTKLVGKPVTLTRPSRLSQSVKGLNQLFTQHQNNGLFSQPQVGLLTPSSETGSRGQVTAARQEEEEEEDEEEEEEEEEEDDDSDDPDAAPKTSSHIPKGRRAGSTLPQTTRRKSGLALFA